MSELSGDFVKRGMWTNIARGPVMGKIITTDIQTGAVVIALLAVISSLGTAHLWHLIAFAYHQSRATGQPTDGMFRQQQALLRSLPTPSSVMADSVKLWWAWRKRMDRAFIRSLFPFVLALFCTMGSIAASIASSYVVDSTNLEVLVRSPFCGHVNNTDPTLPQQSYLTAVHDVATPYAQQCYRDDSTLPERCRAYVRPNIRLTVERVPCPFAAGMCVTAGMNSTPAVAVDSGLVNLNERFGMNLAKSDHVRFRKRTTCANLPIDGYMEVVNASLIPDYVIERDMLPGEQLILGHYGNRPILPPNLQNISMAASLLQQKVTYTVAMQGNSYYRAPIRGESNWFIARPELVRDDADIAVLFVTKGAIVYQYPIDDPLFAAHRTRTKMDFATGANTTMYLPDSMMSPVGCTQQFQFCIATKSGEKCSTLSYLPDDPTADFPQASAVQKTVLQLLSKNTYMVDIANNQALNFTSKINNVQQVVPSKVPDDQWITEVHGWESYAWASLQILMTDYAIGPRVRDPAGHGYEVAPQNDGDRQLCGAQKMRKNGGFVNINVFGLTFIITLSLTIAIIDITLLKFLIFLSKCRHALAPRIDRWIQDGVLQLQRRAYEAQREGTWTDLNKDVPLTMRSEKLRDLPLESLPSWRQRQEKEVREEWGLKKMQTESSIVVPILRKTETERTLVTSPTTPSIPSKKSVDNCETERMPLPSEREEPGLGAREEVRSAWERKRAS